MMNADERKCMKAACAEFRKAAAAHDRREAQHRSDDNADAADCHKDAAAGLRAGCAHLEKAASLPVGNAGSDGVRSTEETNEGGDVQAKRSTEEIDRLLMKDRTNEMGKAVAADPIATLAAELAL
jgi:hypothetical protein